uniref:Uncharacterized protein n=1 Tax=Eutreptiella gymnastica TaxID=73025 RepID=A0A7S4FQY3_9EUGL
MKPNNWALPSSLNLTCGSHCEIRRLGEGERRSAFLPRSKLQQNHLSVQGVAADLQLTCISLQGCCAGKGPSVRHLANPRRSGRGQRNNTTDSFSTIGRYQLAKGT